MPFLCNDSSSLCNTSTNRSINSLTSSCGILQFSLENEYTVRYFIPTSLHKVTIFFNVSAPFLWPTIRGKPLFRAHLPLPSIIIAIWIGILFFFISLRVGDLKGAIIEEINLKTCSLHFHDFFFF